MEQRRVLFPGRPAGLRVLSLPGAGLLDIGALRQALRTPDADETGDADDAILAAPGVLVDAAVLVGVVTGPVPGVLLTKRTATLRRHAGQVSFPGGRIDPEDAGPEAAALREAWEEVGLRASDVELCGRLPPYVTATGYCVVPVLALLTPGFETRLSADEVASIFELPLAVLLDEAAPTRQRAAFQGAWREYWVWPHAEHEIWGATAAMLMQLARRLRRQMYKK